MDENWFGPAEDPFAVTPFRTVARAVTVSGPQGVSSRVFHELALSAGYSRGAADLNGAFRSHVGTGFFDRINGRVYATHVAIKGLADLTAQMESHAVLHTAAA